jgi:plasmid stabilization system protein ParE
MPGTIVWLPGAARDVARLREFIKNKNPSAPQRAASRIKEAAQILIENPEAGKPA